MCTRTLLAVLVLSAGGEIAGCLVPSDLGVKWAPCCAIAAPEGLAAKYPGDAGLAEDPAVLCVEDFESWKRTDAPAGWAVRTSKTSRTRTVPGRVTAGAPGDRVLEVACWTTGTGSQVGGISRKLGNYNHANEGLGDGPDEVWIRYYVKFGEPYEAVRNHGANLGGRDVTRPGSAWVGMAGIRDVSTRGYFYSGVQPRGKRGTKELEMGFYSYHLDKRGPWGENYEVQTKVPIAVGKWYCVERHMKLNSVRPGQEDPAQPDGVEELWIDGRLTIRNPRVRFRRVPELHITLFSLETYYHGLPAAYTADNPIRVYFDHVVIARKYIGPLRPGTEPGAKR
jgi:hypothetical protein